MNPSKSTGRNSGNRATTTAASSTATTTTAATDTTESHAATRQHARPHSASSPPRLSMAHSKEKAALRAAWTDLKNVLYRDGLVQDSPSIQMLLRDLECSVVAYPGYSGVQMSVRTVASCCLRAGERLDPAANASRDRAFEAMDRALKVMAQLPDRGRTSFDKYLRSQMPVADPRSPISSRQVAGLFDYRRADDSAQHDHPAVIADIVRQLGGGIAATTELDGSGIEEQWRDIVLQAGCTNPDADTLAYLARELHISIRRKIDLDHREHIALKFQLSQLIGAIGYLPPRIPSPLQLKLEAGRQPSSDRPRATSTPARPALVTIPLPIRAWMKLRKMLKMHTALDRRTLTGIGQQFTDAATKPSSAQRRAELENVNLQLRSAIDSQAQMTDQARHAVNKAVQTYADSVVTPRVKPQPIPRSPLRPVADRIDTPASRGSRAGTTTVALPKREETLSIRSLAADLEAVVNGWDPFADVAQHDAGNPTGTNQPGSGSGSTGQRGVAEQ